MLETVRRDNEPLVDDPEDRAVANESGARVEPGRSPCGIGHLTRALIRLPLAKSR